MADLALYLGIALVGYGFGALFRKYRDKFKWTGHATTVAIIIMVTSMGLRMGANDKVTSNLASIGFFSFIITTVIMTMSVLSVTLLRRFMGMDRQGYLKNKCTTDENETSDGNKEKLNTMTLLIVGAVVIGGLMGYFASLTLIKDAVTFDSVVGLIITIGLCVLLFFVGLDMGLDGTVIKQLITVGFRVLFIPITVVIGTLLGAVICGLILPISIKEGLIVGSGFGWYSLAPSIIMDHGLVVISAISFLHNVMREMLAFVFMPLVAEKIGYVETVALPGAAAMDVCLPMVERTTRGDIAVFSFISGLVLSIAVPIMVPIMLSL